MSKGKNVCPLNLKKSKNPIIQCSFKGISFFLERIAILAARNPF